MTGSPVFRFNANSTWQQKIHRKLNFVRDIPKNQLRLHVDNLIEKEEHNEKDIAESVKTSSLSSFVFSNKKGVKRKLDFDNDDSSDDVVSSKLNMKNISLCGFQSKNSSLIDIRSITLSPNKNRIRSSYSRSSVTSTCRRRLFTDNESYSKKPKLESPVLCQNTKQKEIKLSLKKKFPGVPNSDSARSGLLLNLAFSKYNLSNTEKQGNISVDFVEDSSIKASKKEFMQFSTIKNDDSSFGHSPVFMSVKKVKRRLNLEDGDSSTIGNIDMLKNNMELEINESNIINENHESTSDFISDKLNGGNEKNQLEISEINENISQESSDAMFLEKIEKNEGWEKNLIFKSNLYSPIMKAYKDSNTSRKDLFKNSKLRSSLKNKIFNLSKTNRNDLAEPFSVSNIEYSSAIEKNYYLSYNNSKNKCKNISKDLKNKRKKYDRIVINTAISEKSKDTNYKQLNKDHCSRSVTNKKKLIDDSFNKCKLSTTFDQNQEIFSNLHIQRFLNDCLNVLEQGIDGENFSNDSSHTIETSKLGINSQSMESLKTFKIENCESQENKIHTKSDFIIESESQDANITKEIEKFVMTVESPERMNNKYKNITSRCDESITEVKSNYIIECTESENTNEQCDKIDFIIENATSQEINKQCIEEVELFIEDINSPDEYYDSKINDCCDILSENSASQFPSENETRYQSKVTNSDIKVEEVPSPESPSFHCQYLDALNLNNTPAKSDINNKNEIITFDSLKKRKRKKHSPDSLVFRLEKLVTREKSSVRIWEYEILKKNEMPLNSKGEVAVFCVKKIWKEFSRLIVLCSFFNQDLPNKVYEQDQIKNFGIDVSNSVIIVIEPAYYPKNLTYSTVFQVHPPWEIMFSKKCDYIVILRPYKIEIISKYEKLPLCRDPMLPNNPTIIEHNQFCSCDEICDCTLPEGYQTVIQPLLLCSDIFSFKKYSRLKSYNMENLKSVRCINDIILKHKLYSSEYLYLDLRILHIHKTKVCDDLLFWHIICMDEEREICCVVINDNTKLKFLNVNKEVMFRFFGILPWKLIPVKSISLFIDHIEFSDYCDIYEKLGNDNLYVFVMSDKYGQIKCLN